MNFRGMLQMIRCSYRVGADLGTKSRMCFPPVLQVHQDVVGIGVAGAQGESDGVLAVDADGMGAREAGLQVYDRPAVNQAVRDDTVVDSPGGLVAVDAHVGLFDVAERLEEPVGAPIRAEVGPEVGQPECFVGEFVVRKIHHPRHLDRILPAHAGVRSEARAIYFCGHGGSTFSTLVEQGMRKACVRRKQDGLDSTGISE